MQTTRYLLEAFAKLRADTYWQRICGDLQRERAAKVSELVNGYGLTEYDRAVIAGRIQCLDELLDLADTAAVKLETFRTK